jgi:hypothetical protein
VLVWEQNKKEMKICESNGGQSDKDVKRLSANHGRKMAAASDKERIGDRSMNAEALLSPSPGTDSHSLCLVESSLTPVVSPVC